MIVSGSPHYRLFSAEIERTIDGTSWTKRIITQATHSAESAYPPTVRDAIAVMREAYVAPFDAQKVASAVGVSPAQLTAHP